MKFPTIHHFFELISSSIPPTINLSQASCIVFIPHRSWSTTHENKTRNDKGSLGLIGPAKMKKNLREF